MKRIISGLLCIAALPLLFAFSSHGAEEGLSQPIEYTYVSAEEDECKKACEALDDAEKALEDAQDAEKAACDLADDAFEAFEDACAAFDFWCDTVVDLTAARDAACATGSVILCDRAQAALDSAQGRKNQAAVDKLNATAASARANIAKIDAILARKAAEEAVNDAKDAKTEACGGN